MRRIVRGVQRFERHPQEGDADLDDRAAAGVQVRRDLNDAGLIAGREKTKERVRQLVKREELFGSGADNAAGDEVHESVDQ